MRKYILLIITFLLTTHITKSDVVQFVAEVDVLEVEIGDRLNISYTLNTRGDNFVPPIFEGFNTLSGPNQETSMQWINGKVSHTIKFSYILQAAKVGKFTFKPASILVSGKYVTSNEVVLTVVQGNKSNLNTAQQSNKKELIFANISSNLNPVYAGEPVVISQKIYTRINLTQIINFKPTEISSLWVKQVKLPEQIQLKPINLGGMNYNFGELMRNIVIAQKPGRYTIPSFNISVLAQHTDSRFGNNIFDQFFSMDQQERFDLLSNSLTLSVLPLPTEGKPSDFGGAVGYFSISSNLDKNSIDVNDAITLTIEIKGDGNIELFQPPSLKELKSFEVFEPQEKSDIKVQNNEISGVKKIDQLIVPSYAGEFEIPDIPFSYFDPKEKRYKTIKTRPIKFKITGIKKANNVNTFNQKQVQRKESISQINDDIRFLKTNLNLVKKESNIIGSWKMFPLCGLTLMILISGIIIRRNKENYIQNPEYYNKRKATKIARKHLEKAKKAMLTNNKSFYAEINQSIWRYLGYKFGLKISEFSKNNLIKILNEYKIKPEYINGIIKIYEKCEMAQYYNVENTDSKNDIFNDTIKAITNFENSI